MIIEIIKHNYSFIDTNLLRREYLKLSPKAAKSLILSPPSMLLSLRSISVIFTRIGFSLIGEWRVQIQIKVKSY